MALPFIGWSIIKDFYLRFLYGTVLWSRLVQSCACIEKHTTGTCMNCKCRIWHLDQIKQSWHINTHTYTDRRNVECINWNMMLWILKIVCTHAQTPTHTLAQTQVCRTFAESCVLFKTFILFSGYFFPELDCYEKTVQWKCWNKLIVHHNLCCCHDNKLGKLWIGFDVRPHN